MAVVKSRKGISKRVLTIRACIRLKRSKSINKSWQYFYKNDRKITANNNKFLTWSSHKNKLNFYDTKKKLSLLYESFF
jgi:hypothetical protein